MFPVALRSGWPKTSRRKPIVLVVDDDAGVRSAIHLILDEAYEVVDATDASAAFAVIHARPVSVILLDILLPGVDGLETLRDMRRLDPRVPIIMVTCHGVGGKHLRCSHHYDTRPLRTLRRPDVGRRINRRAKGVFRQPCTA